MLNTPSISMIQLPTRISRWLYIAYGLMVFFWLSPEDSTVWISISLGLLGAILLVASLLVHYREGLSIPVNIVAGFGLGIGGVIGFLTGPLTTLLMIVKNARHAHLYPDFSPGLILEILERLPIWTLAGGLFGLGVGLYWRSTRLD